MQVCIVFMFSERGYSKLKYNYFTKKHTLLPLQGEELNVVGIIEQVIASRSECCFMTPIQCTTIYSGMHFHRNALLFAEDV